MIIKTGTDLLSVVAEEKRLVVRINEAQRASSVEARVLINRLQILKEAPESRYRLAPDANPQELLKAYAQLYILHKPFLNVARAILLPSMKEQMERIEKIVDASRRIV